MMFSKKLAPRGVHALLGFQYGDEGKGKIADALVSENQYGLAARFQGGSNAGHTLEVGSEKIVLHTIPCGIFREDLPLLLGAGMVINPVELLAEIQAVQAIGIDLSKRLFVSLEAALVLPTASVIDRVIEHDRAGFIGTTLKGIGPTYTQRAARTALSVSAFFSGDFRRVVKSLVKEDQFLLNSRYAHCRDVFDQQWDAPLLEEWFAATEQLFTILSKEQCVSSWSFVRDILRTKPVLAEGAQGTHLDVFHGTTPYVTSSHTISGGVATGLGVSPSSITEVIGVIKAYETRVGKGPFPSEIFGETAEQLCLAGAEYGATTGRKRRIGWLDLEMLKKAVAINGLTRLVVNKLDILDTLPEFCVVEKYDAITGEPILRNFKTGKIPSTQTQLSPEHANLCNYLEDFLRTESPEAQLSLVGIGSKRDDLFVYTR